jgi:bacterioferritin-associated ferredoxin
MYEFIKCRCHGVMFSRLKALALKEGITSISELQSKTLFGDNCRRCVPFVGKMLKTGQTEFKVAEADDFEDVPNPVVDIVDSDYGDESEL